MPDIEAPSAPAAPSAAPAPAPTPAPQKAIHVGADGRMGRDSGPAPEPPKPKSARADMFQNLRKRAGITESPPEPEPKVAPTKPGEGKEGEPTPEPGEVSNDPAPAPGEGEAPAPAPDKKRNNPWKLVDEFKKRSAQLEKDLLEARKGVPDPKEKEEWTNKLSAIEARNRELEEHIRFVDYSKSKEFSEKYQKPYDEAWHKAMTEMGELTLTDDNGQERPIQPQDILGLVNLPLKQAREQANALFGDFADDIMAHRNQIKQLFDAQQKALTEARKAGAEREKNQQESWTRQMSDIQKQVAQTWTKTNETLLKDEKNAKFFKPMDGDEEGNNRLKRGYEMVDKALAANPMDPRLTPEQRQQVVELHAAVRNRAAAAGRLLYWFQRECDDHAKTKAILEKYRNAEPGKANGAPPAAAPSSGKASDQVYGALRKLAH